MARTFEKDVLYPGTYSVGSAGQRRLVRFTKDDLPDGVGKDGALSVPFLARRMKDMLGRNIQVPLSWEHQDTVKPMTAAQRKKDFATLTCGYAASAGLHPDGFLTTNVEVDDTKDAERMPSVRYVSPQIDMDVIDGDGNLWHGPSITHLAVTSRPVQHRQKPFRPVAMSRQSIRLSMSDYVGPDDEDQRLGMDAKRQKAETGHNPPSWVKDEPKWEKAKEAAKKSYKEADDAFWPSVVTIYKNMGGALHPTNLSEGPDMADEPKEPKDGEEIPEGTNFAEVLSDLAEFDPPIVLPDDTTPESFIERLSVALKAIKGSKGVVDVTEPDKTPKPEPDSTSPMMMSLKAENKTLRGTLSTLATADLGRRIDTLSSTRRVSKPIADKLRSALKKEPISLSQNGTLDSCSLLHKIEAYEELDEEAAFGGHSRLDLSRATPQDPPGEEDDKAVQDIADRLSGRNGIKK